MYTHRNFKSKKELKAAVAAWNDFVERTKDSPLTSYGTVGAVMMDKVARNLSAPRAVTYFQPGPFGGNEPRDGTIYCEGPHYPQPHR